MSRVDVALDTISVVVKGRFNAAIFSPLWLLQQELIGTTDFTAAKIEVIASEFALFSTGWLRCEVVPDALQLHTSHPAESERLRDVAVGILNTLPHTPVGALGINRAVHFAARSTSQYHAVGDQLAPKQFWEGLVTLPTTRQVAIWGERPDQYGGRVQIQVEPSFRFPNHVFVGHNDHFDLTTKPHKPKTREEAWIEAQHTVEVEPSADRIPVANEILTTVWASSIERSDNIVNAIARIE